jgi:glycosyltransferase involved in cell wall biosynthesis
MLSIAYLTNIPTPYRVAMINAWALELGPLGKLTVYYTDQGDQGRGWDVPPAIGVEEIRLPVIAAIPKYGILNRGLIGMVRDNDVLIIGGLEQASYLLAATLMRLLRKKVILLFDGFSPRRFEGEKAAVRWLKRMTANLCHAYFANGKVGERYLRQIKAAPKPCFNQYLSVSTQEIDSFAASGVMSQEIRRHFGLPVETKLVAFCGYIIERKRLDLLIAAVGEIPMQGRPVLVVIGEGPLRAISLRLATELAVDIRFVGFQKPAALAQLYQSVDLLVLPSDDDPWGLVVNEAMAACRPVIVSDACGCAEDLVVPNVNGFIFRSGDVGDLSDCLRRALCSDLVAMGLESRKIIDRWTPEHSARSLSQCIAYVLKQPPMATSR